MRAHLGNSGRCLIRKAGLVGARVALPLCFLIGAAYASASPAAAQEGWTPTVATVPGGTLNPPNVLNRQPTKIDPRYFPAPRANDPPPRYTLPQGAWSPIVTGAIPQTDPPEPVRSSPLRTVPGSAVAPLNGLSPVRPVAPKAAVAAADAPAAAEKPSPDKTAAGAPATGTPTPGAGADEPLFKKPGPLDALPPNASAAEQYCFNTADSAADARFAWQAKKIQDMEAELDKKAQQLEAKTEEYKRWLERRDEFARKAHEKLVGFYSRMRPDAAAVQIATLDEEMAAAVVIKLETKVASQIMGEMDPERAAKIATIISGAGKIPPEKRRATTPAGTADATPPAGSSPPAQGAPPAPEEPRS